MPQVRHRHHRHHRKPSNMAKDHLHFFPSSKFRVCSSFFFLLFPGSKRRVQNLLEGHRLAGEKKNFVICARSSQRFLTKFPLNFLLLFVLEFFAVVNLGLLLNGGKSIFHVLRTIRFSKGFSYKHEKHLNWTFPNHFPLSWIFLAEFSLRASWWKNQSMPKFALKFVS